MARSARRASSAFLTSGCGQFFRFGEFALKQEDELFPRSSFKLPGVTLRQGQQFDGFLRISQPRFQAPKVGPVFLQLAGHVQHREQPVCECPP